MKSHPKRAAIFAAVLLLCGLCPPALSHAQNFVSKKEQPTISAPALSLRAGEKLEYSVEWFGFNVGRITLETAGSENLRGRDCYHIIARGQPNKFLAKLHDLEYTVHTYIDKEKNWPLRFEKTRRLRDKFTYTTIDFDHAAKKATYQSSGNAPCVVFSPNRPELEKGVAATFDIPLGAQDLLSSLYYFRLLEVEPGKTYPINTYYGARNWKLMVGVEEPFIKDIRKKGTLTVFRVRMTSLLSEFILGRSALFVTFTADSRRLPTEFRLGTGIGPITGFIQDLEAAE